MILRRLVSNHFTTRLPATSFLRNSGGVSATGVGGVVVPGRSPTGGVAGGGEAVAAGSGCWVGATGVGGVGEGVGGGGGSGVGSGVGEGEGLGAGVGGGSSVGGLGQACSETTWPRTLTTLILWVSVSHHSTTFPPGFFSLSIRRRASAGVAAGVGLGGGPEGGAVATGGGSSGSSTPIPHPGSEEEVGGGSGSGSMPASPSGHDFLKVSSRSGDSTTLVLWLDEVYQRISPWGSWLIRTRIGGDPGIPSMGRSETYSAGMNSRYTIRPRES